MAEFIHNITPTVLSNVFDNQTYYLVPLTFGNENNILVNVEKDATMFDIINKGENTTEQNNNWIAKIREHDFSAEIATMLTACFPVINGDIISYLNRDNYVNYAMFSGFQLKHCYEYFLISEEFDSSMMTPLSFCSMELHNDANLVQVKRSQGGEWESSQYYMLYNVCKTNTQDVKNACSNMLNMIVSDSTYTEMPLFLFVDPSNEAAVKCYTKNMFQTVVDVFTSDQLPHGENTIYMCYNKHTLRLNNQTRTYQLAPSIKTRIALVAHGALEITPDIAFATPFVHTNHEGVFYYPFENLQFYTQLGKGLLSGLDNESNAIVDVCYEQIIAKETIQPDNTHHLKLISMMFSGFNAKTDPQGRERFIGFYNCNKKERIKENTELFGENNDKILYLEEVFKYLYKHCVENMIDVNNVELKIFACRGFCPVGDFAMRAMAGGDEPVIDNGEPEREFQTSNKESFYNFLLEQPNECEIVGGKKNKKSNQKSKQKTKRFLSKALRRTMRKKK